MTTDSGRETKTCPTCDGIGWTVPDNANEPRTSDNVKCTTCNGDGFVYVD